MDKEYYDQLRKTAIEVLGNPEEDQETEVKDDEDDDGRKEMGGGDDDDLELKYRSVVEVSGTKIALASDNEETLEKAHLTLSGFFEHYIPSPQVREGEM